MNGLENLSGTISEIYYTNEDNGYTACQMITDEQDFYDLVGCMPLISCGQKITAYGNFSISPTYGEQFRVEYYEALLPEEEDNIINYLASGIVEGIRLATAKKLVAHFGNDTLNIMLNEPERLAEVKGISEAKAEKIGISFKNVQSLQSIVLFLQKYSIPISHATKIYQTFGSKSVEQINQNPYILADCIQGISFTLSDKIAMSIGMPTNSIFRIKSAIIYTLKDAAYREGHSYMPKSLLTEHISYLLGVSDSEVENAYASLIEENKIVSEITNNAEGMYLFELYEEEYYIARRLVSMASTPVKNCPKPEEIERRLTVFAEKENISLAAEQRNAIITAMVSGCMVLTGGPGTGKTTTINTIIQLFKERKLSVALAAPTGRAAKRMSQVSGTEAKTIHRLLETEVNSEGFHIFNHNASNPLSADVIIVDEVSMMDTSLMASLLKAVKFGARVILAGDSDQLPSVGPGNVLKNIIESNAVPVIKLTKIFRQAEQSLIIVNAHKINRCEIPELDNHSNDFFYLQRNSLAQISSTTVDLYTNRLPKSYKVNPLSHIQVITPTKKTEAGTTELNTVLQEAINPSAYNKVQFKFDRTTFRTGDKVMQTRNNYDMEFVTTDQQKGMGIFNGDMGIIENIDLEERYMTILFDEEKYVEYSFELLKDLELAYAITVHKSQGSEFPIVIIPIGKYFSRLMNKNLFYTAVTRARDIVVLVGSRQTIYNMVQNTTTSQRYTGLYEKLCTVKAAVEKKTE